MFDHVLVPSLNPMSVIKKRAALSTAVNWLYLKWSGNTSLICINKCYFSTRRNVYFHFQLNEMKTPFSRYCVFIKDDRPMTMFLLLAPAATRGIQRRLSTSLKLQIILFFDDLQICCSLIYHIENEFFWDTKLFSLRVSFTQLAYLSVWCTLLYHLVSLQVRLWLNISISSYLKFHNRNHLQYHKKEKLYLLKTDCVKNIHLWKTNTTENKIC